MSTITSDPAPSGQSMRILVWDVPTRVFHWSLAASFAIAWLTAESERLRNLHLVAGYTLLVLLAFRLLWGLTGTRYARFAEFLRGPGAIVRYLRSLFSGRPEHHVGHNPAGALAIVGLLLLGLLTGASGWVTYNEIGGEWWEELHEGVATGMLAVVLVHLAGVVVSSVLHRENLVGAMLTGRKSGAPEDGIGKSRIGVALLLVALLTAIWGVGLRDSPATLPGLDLAASSSGGTGSMGATGETGATGGGADRKRATPGTQLAAGGEHGGRQGRDHDED